MSYLCYLIVSFDSSKTYIGITNDFTKRLRQHNGEIKGGAKYTTQGRPWRLIAHIKGFENHIQVLQFEWAFKYVTRSVKGKTPLLRRGEALYQLVHKDRWTKSSPESCTIPLVIEVHSSFLPAKTFPSYINILVL